MPSALEDRVRVLTVGGIEANVARVADGVLARILHRVTRKHHVDEWRLVRVMRRLVTRLVGDFNYGTTARTVSRKRRAKVHGMRKKPGVNLRPWSSVGPSIQRQVAVNLAWAGKQRIMVAHLPSLYAKRK